MIPTDIDNTKAEPDVLDRLIEERRKKLPESTRPPNHDKRWGLALSGGGIRSSVFCYGLITALAKAKVFSRFDLMSTVSGGGYIGSMVGRLAQNAKSANELQDKLGVNGAISHHRSWLRANSRYLTPRGSRDWLYAVVTFLRNLAGVHLELGFLAVLLACALGFIDILAWYGMNQLIKAYPTLPFGYTSMQLWELVSKWPTLWLALPVIILWAIGAVAWYWYMPTAGRERAQVDVASHKATRQLTLAVRTGIAFVLLGGIDWIAWHLAKQPPYLLQRGALFALILSMLRLALPMLQQSGSSSEFLRQWLPDILNLAGKFVLLVLAIFWTSLVHAFATSKVWVSEWNHVDYIGAALALAVPAVISLGWITLSGRNLEFLNRSSLHNFYRSRLSRAYLGAANTERESDSKVTDVHDDDDVTLDKYTPHQCGGPIHIINVCINQTYQREGLYNIDRQGGLMSLVGPGYYKIQGQQWQQLEPETLNTLGTWMAVSGAAAAPGMGSLTRPGIASMLTILGVRLGYWWRAGSNKDPQWWSRWFPKYMGLYSELLAKFDGTTNKTQYLSDGGHSENTAVYSLLEARCELIVMADCAADPDYKFQDLENLIRRARIDMNVDIQFIKPPQGSHPLFGSLDDLASLDKPACLALARVEYPDNDLPGVLVLVKPNLTSGLPEDVYNYSRDFQDFPQESTADQFFDEAQWESYFSLGCHLGRDLDRKKLQTLIAAVRSGDWVDARVKTPQDNTSAVNATGTFATTPADSETTDNKSRRPLRIPVKSAAAAGLGLGVLLTSASGLWAAFENVKGEDIAESGLVLKPLYGTYGPLPVSMNEGQLNESVGHMAAQLLTTWQTLRSQGQQDLFLNNPEALDMLRMTYGLCARMSDKLAACNTLIKTFECPPKPTASLVALNNGYWAHEEPPELARMNERKAQTYCDTDEPESESLQVAATTPEKDTPESPPVVASVPESNSNVAVVSPQVHPSPDQPASMPPPTVTGLAPSEARVCEGITIFIQIYSPIGRDNVRTLRSLWRAEGASVPPIEDVSSTARRQGRSAPTPYGKPTIIYHQQDAEVCAKALPRIAFQPEQSWDVVALNERFKKVAGTIEVWLPPVAVAEGFAQWTEERGYCYQEYNPLAQHKELYSVHCHPSLAACEDARGSNIKRKQSACVKTELNSGGASMLTLSGWAGSRYNMSQTMFGPPFAPIPGESR